MTIESPETPIKKTRTVIIAIISITIFYLLYKAYQYSNIKFRTQELIPYDKDLNWETPPNCEYDSKLYDAILADMFICSSSNTPFISNLKYDYLDLEMIKKVLLAGARYIEFTVIENDLSDDPTPVIAKKIPNDAMTTTFNSLELADVCYTVIKFAFQSFYDDKNQLAENRYPLFVYFDIQSKNINLLNDVANTIKNIWRDRLLDDTYNHAFNDLAHVPLCKLFGKIVIMTDRADDYQSSQFDSLINYSKLMRIHYNEISSYNLIERARKEGKTNITREEIINDPNHIDLTKLDIDTNDMGKYIIESPDYLTEYTKENLVVVYPNTDNDLTMKNHDFSMAIAHGCNFVCMNFQVYDKYAKKYFETFQKSPLILKNLKLRMTRDKIKKIIPPMEVPSPLMDKIITGAQYTFKDMGIGFMPFYQDGIYSKYNHNTHRLIISDLPTPTPNNKYNKHNFEEASVFIIENGLADISKSISFKSVKFPNRYLQMVGNIIQLMPYDGTTKFKKNGSFMLVDAGKEDDLEYYRIISALDKEKFVRVVDDQLVLNKYKGEQTFDDETKFSFGITKIAKFRSFKSNSGKYLRILDGGFLISNISHIDTSTKFKIRSIDDEHYAIIASNGNLLEYNGNNAIAATATEPKGNYTKIRIVKEGNLYKLTTFFSPHMKTLYIVNNGATKVSYDGNILGPGRTAPTLPSTKYFKLVETYGIEKEEQQII
jgi:hypothetical protein